MTKLFETIVPEAQEELIRDGVIKLVTVVVEAVPHPDRPDDRSTMTIAAEVYHEFREGIPAIDEGLARIRGTCSVAAEDISPAARDRLLTALDGRRRETDVFRQGKMYGESIESRFSPRIANLLRPEIFDLDPKVMVWCYAWTAGMSDDGLMCIDCDQPVFFEGIDEASRVRVLERVHTVNAGIAEIVEPLMREG